MIFLWLPSLFTHFLYSNKPLMSDRIIHLLRSESQIPSFCLSIAGLPLMLKHRIFVLWSVSPVAKLAILFSTIQLHPCPQHQSPWRTLSCFQVYFFLVRLPVAVELDDEYPLSFLIHCRQHPSS